MKVSIHRLLDGLEDSSVAIEEVNVVSARRIKELTFIKLGETTPGKHLSKHLFPLALAAVLVIALSVAAYAIVSGQRLFVLSGPQLSSTSLRDTSKVEDAVGFRVIAPERFYNGCQFISMTVYRMDISEENCDEAVSYNSVHFAYATPDSEGFSMSLYPALAFEHGYIYEPEPVEHRIYAGNEIRLNRECYKYVPYDYKLTEDDRIREAAGHFVVIRDKETSDIWEQSTSAAFFELFGVMYVLSGDVLVGTDSQDWLDTLADMAEEVIDAAISEKS